MTDRDRSLYLGAYAICVRDERILLVRIGAGLDAGRWTLPGGGVEWGEPPDETVVREVREETGYDGVIQSMAGTFSAVYERTADRSQPPVHHIGILYWMETSDGEPVNEIGGSTDRCEWVPFSHVDSLSLCGAAPLGWELASKERAAHRG